MIEAPGASSGPLGLRERRVQIRIDVEADGPGLPLNGVEMKIIGEILAGGKAEGRAGIARLGDGAGAVERAVNRAGLLADIFHDVDFAALGPADRTDVIPKHPEGGPHSLSRGNFNARLETAIRLAEEALRFQTGGGVIARRAVAAGIGRLAH